MYKLPILILLLLTACQARQSTSADIDRSQKPTALFAREWQVHESANSEAAPDSDTQPYLSLDESTSQVSGYGGCNRFFGTFRLENDTLSFEDIGSTKRACPKLDREQAFFLRLKKVTSYKLEQDRLLLLDARGEVVLTLNAR